MPTKIAIPFRLDSTGKIAAQEDPDRQVNSDAMSLVATTPGERVMMSKYGTGLTELLFETLDTEDVSVEVTERVKTGMAIWEPDIVLRRVNPTFNDQGLVKVDVDISAGGSTGKRAWVNRATVFVGGQVSEQIRG